MKSSIAVKSMVALAMISALLLLIVLALLTYRGDATNGMLGFLISHHLSIMVLLVLVSVATGAVIVLLLSHENAQQQRAVSGAAMLLLTFLSPDERVVVEHLAKDAGSALQSQLSAALGFSAVRMHRIALRLQTKRFITLERYGKTNKLLLAPELRIALVDATQTEAADGR